MPRRQNLKSRKDLTGQRFGRLTATFRLESRISPNNKLYSVWLCKCDCGKDTEVSLNALLGRRTKSCGCFAKETASVTGLTSNLKHGGASTHASVDDSIRFQTLQHIRARARKNGYETDLEVSDLPVLSDSCPILGIKYKKRKGALSDASVSIDRLNSNLPYLRKYKHNLVFISYRANRIKNDATLAELEKVVEYLESNLGVASKEARILSD